MHVYGLMPAPLAAAATLAFCAFLALYPALALGVSQRLAPAAWIRLPLLLPAAWTLSEWLRGTLFTGFPWLASGYAHTDSVLAGFAPVAGVYGVTLAAALLAGALALFALPLQRAGADGLRVDRRRVRAADRRWRGVEEPGLDAAGRRPDLSAPGAGQHSAGHQVRSRGPAARVRRALGADAGTAGRPGRAAGVGVPGAAAVRSAAVPRGVRQPTPATGDSALVFGVFLEQPAGAYFNSAVGIAPGDAPPARYSKRHLVPFGEFIPPGFRWFVDLMQMPIGDQQRGAAVQPPMELAGQRIAVNICYEDLFGEVIIDAWQGGAPPTIMLNMSNLAWFQDSLALPQHLQISRMRALETQHPMLRATNTGATAIIDASGRVTGALPFLTAGALTGQVQGMQGTTPFIRWGNGPAVVLALLLGLARGRARLAGGMPPRPKWVRNENDCYLVCSKVKLPPSPSRSTGGVDCSSEGAGPMGVVAAVMGLVKLPRGRAAAVADVQASSRRAGRSSRPPA